MPDPLRPDPQGAGGRPPFDASAAWELDPQVALRPESFGALAYHFGTRRLSFLKSPALVAVVEALAGAESAGQACVAAGIAPDDPAVGRALTTLAATGMIRPREAA